MSSETLKKIFFMEPTLNGHHGPYLIWMVEGFLKEKMSVTVILTNRDDSFPVIELERLEKIYHENMNLIYAKDDLPKLSDDAGIVSLICREYKFRILFKNWFDKYVRFHKPDSALIILPYADYCLYAIGLMGSPFRNYRWLALTMRPSFHYIEQGVIAPSPKLSKVKKYLFDRALGSRRLEKLLSIDELLVEYISRYSSKKNKICYFPEPAEAFCVGSSAASKQSLGLINSDKTILLYGAITARKGGGGLLDAILYDGFPKNVNVIIAGRIDDENVLARLRSKACHKHIESGRLKVIDRFIKNEEEAVLFAAADIVWLVYKGHSNSSGVFAQALANKCIVLSSPEGLIGWYTSKYNAGIIVSDSRPQSIAEAVKSAVELIDNKSTVGGGGNQYIPPTTREAQARLVSIAIDNFIENNNGK